MKRTGILSVLIGLGLIGFVATKALASEGVIELAPREKMGAKCYALSVFIDGRFEINSSCRGLQVPYSAELTRYVMWAIEPDGNTIRLGEVKNGKLSHIISDRFNSLMVTVEASAQPRKPSEIVIASGAVKGISFFNETSTITPTPTPTTKPISAAGDVKDDEVSERTTLSRILGTIGRVVGIGFLVLLVGVIVMTVVTRRKETI